jgi:predicted transcriptional regulator
MSDVSLHNPPLSSSATTLTATSSLSLTQSATALIIAGFVRNNHVAPTALPSLVAAVMTTLAGIGGSRMVADAPSDQPAVPAVDPRRSVGKDHVTCLTCGVKMKMLRRHIKSRHGMTPDAYRAFWNLPSEYPMTCRSYSETRSDLARKAGLGLR